LKKGKVIIQSYQPRHPVITDVIRHDYLQMYQRQLVERRKFNYPPFTRLIRIIIKHRDAKALNKAADLLAIRLKKTFGKRILGPEYPLVGRIRNYYLKQILVKIEREANLHLMKEKLMAEMVMFSQVKDFGAFRLVIDVDPQ